MASPLGLAGESTWRYECETRGWSHLHPHLLDMVQELLEDTYLLEADFKSELYWEDQSRISMLKIMRCVNRHWCVWATMATQSLRPLITISSVKARLDVIATKFTNLTSLSLGRCWYDPIDSLLEWTQLLARLPRLTHVDMAGSDISDAGLLSLPALPALRKLDLGMCENIGGEALRHLTALTSLSLRGTWWDGMLQQVKHLSRLVEVDLAGCDSITDGTLVALSGLQALSSLSLDECDGITDDVFSSLALLSSLTHVSLKFCPISNLGLGQLVNLSSLTSVDVSGCSEITMDGLRECRAALPDLDIVAINTLEIVCP
ncbi:unnamed protein product [Ostreobium quekettii]|uniref:Uncharacterized protein n=1 Tax=Ostreobium quekettii TaxID=121088 RepID=A0A8S1IQ96_9CHLO|nr:unnamed protein product [Ostreobium quekettii]|eukprot:evm.model.scf_1389EXC.4 EVM.evm.TU.scf_1389EXC.4   scf_1389EXC:33409-34362(-)